METITISFHVNICDNVKSKMSIHNNRDIPSLELLHLIHGCPDFFAFQSPVMTGAGERSPGAGPHEEEVEWAGELTAQPQRLDE